MLTVRVAKNIEVVQGQLRLCASTVNSYKIHRQLPPGANAWVFEGTHPHHGRCVVKVLKERGSIRHRMLSGLSEVMRLAQAKSNWVAAAYAGHFDSGIFFYSMEYVEGAPLKEILRGNLAHIDRWSLGKQYIRALNSTKSIVHADPHGGNVIVAPSWQRSMSNPQIKLIDFGPGWPLLKRRLEPHRSTAIHDVMIKVLAPLPGFAAYAGQLRRGRKVSLHRYNKILDALRP